MISDSPGSRDERILKLARLRGESIEHVLGLFDRATLERIPESVFRRTGALLRASIRSTGVDGATAWVQLEDGRIFYGHRSQPAHRREYEFLASHLPAVTADTYLVAKDTAGRFLRRRFYRPEVLPPPDGRFVEVGAYLGHKSIRMATERLSAEGRILAIEMMPENAALLRRNVATAGLDDRIRIVERGVWSGRDRKVVWSLGRQRSSLVPLERRAGDPGRDVETDTLDNLLDEWGESPIDLLAITLNGAELEALEGLERWSEQVRCIYLADRHGGPSGKQRRRQLLREKGFRILSEQGGLYASRPQAGRVATP